MAGAWDRYNSTGSDERGKGAKGKSKGERNKIWPSMPEINYNGARLPCCKKSLYKAHPTIFSMSEKEISLLRLKYGIEVEGDQSLAPVPTLDLMSTFPDEAIQALQMDMSIRTPTPIQMQVWPAAMSGRDVIGVAPTGSGKTLAYLLPMFQHCKAQSLEVKDANTGPKALILVPNVDLAKQIKRTFDQLLRAAKPLRMECMVPGERFPVTGSYDILVASPGRLKGFLAESREDIGSFLQHTTYVVVDEADSLIGKIERDGEQHTTEILKRLRKDIQMLYFTATWDDNLPEEIHRIFPRTNDREALLDVVVDGKTLSGCKSVEQYFLRRNNGEAEASNSADVYHSYSAALNKCWTPEKCKKDVLFDLVHMALNDPLSQKEPGTSKILVFTNSKEKVGELQVMLEENGLPVAGLTGESWGGTRHRTSMVTDFCDPQRTETRILVTTDLLGRGMDFCTCKFVILFEFPHHRNGVREYVHRIGRTGRAGRDGFAMTLLDEEEGDLRHCGDIVKVLKEGGKPAPWWMEQEAQPRNWRRHKQIFFDRQAEKSRWAAENEAAESNEPSETAGTTAEGAAAQEEEEFPLFGTFLRAAGLHVPYFHGLAEHREAVGAPAVGQIAEPREMPPVF